MGQAIKSWESDATGWKLHATRWIEEDKFWYGYI